MGRVNDEMDWGWVLITKEIRTLILELQFSPSAGLVIILFAKSAIPIPKGVSVFKRSCTKRVQRGKLLDTLSIVSQFFWYCSGVTFIMRYSLLFSFNFFLQGISRVGWPGLPLLMGHETRGSGEVVGIFFIADCRGRGIRISSRTFCVHMVLWLFTPSAGGRRSLLGAAWRRRRAGPWPLVTLPGRSGSSAWRIRVSTRLRRLWSAARDVQYYKRMFRTWNVASGGCFWQGGSYIQVDIW